MKQRVQGIILCMYSSQSLLISKVGLECCMADGGMRTRVIVLAEYDVPLSCRRSNSVPYSDIFYYVSYPPISVAVKVNCLYTRTRLFDVGVCGGGSLRVYW